MHSPFARKAARRLGKTQTSVIEEALSKLLSDLEHASDPSDRVAAALGIAADFDRRLSAEERPRLSTDLVYNDRGLPA